MALKASIDGLDQGDFTEGHELPGGWKVAKEMIGRRLSQEEAKRLSSNELHVLVTLHGDLGYTD